MLYPSKPEGVSGGTRSGCPPPPPPSSLSAEASDQVVRREQLRMSRLRSRVPHSNIPNLRRPSTNSAGYHQFTLHRGIRWGTETSTPCLCFAPFPYRPVSLSLSLSLSPGLSISLSLSIHLSLALSVSLSLSLSFSLSFSLSRCLAQEAGQKCV